MKPVAAPGDGAAGRWFHERSELLVLLHRLRSAQSLLSLRCAGDAHWQPTQLLDCDAAGGSLRFDALPRAAPPPGTPLEVRGRIGGGDVDFSCAALVPPPADDGRVLLASWPAAIHLLERRGSHRLRLPPRLDLPPSEIARGLHASAVRLLDISHGGAAALAPPDLPQRPGAALQLRLALPDATLQLGVEVCSATAQAGGQRLGLRFLALARESAVRLAHAVNGLERRLIRAGRS